MAFPATHDLGTLSPNVSSPNHTSYTETFTSPLLSVPRELRDEIYGYLLRCGDLAILRTSKKFGHEARKRLHREGVFRIKMGFPDDGDGDFSCLQQKWDAVQNFHFRLFFHHLRRTKLHRCAMFRQLRYFARHNESSLKRNCLITIEDTTGMSRNLVCHEAYKIRELFAEIARLAVCTEFVADFTPKLSETCCVCDFFPGMEHNEHLDFADKNLIVDNLRTLSGRLDPILGPDRVQGHTQTEFLELMRDRQTFRQWLARKQ